MLKTDNSDCHHIQAAQKNLESLSTLAQTTSIQEAAEVFTRSHTKPVIQCCMSYLPIPPPAWCQLPTDTPINKSQSQSLPPVFTLDSSSHCSCGNSTYADDSMRMTNPFIVYTSTSALQHSIETVYCYACSNTHRRIGPDLGNYCILDWNNKIGFSHQLLNLYTTQFTHSETQFNAFYLTIQDEYLSNESSVEFCSNEIFKFA